MASSKRPAPPDYHLQEAVLFVVVVVYLCFLFAVVRFFVGCFLCLVCHCCLFVIVVVVVFVFLLNQVKQMNWMNQGNQINMVNQVKRMKNCLLAKKEKEEENTRDGSVLDGSDKNARRSSIFVC